MTDVAERLTHVLGRIAEACGEAGRSPDAVALVAVSKTFAPAQIAPAIEAGHRVFGENRVQEAQAKWPDLREGRDDLTLHLIGPLQTNKVRDACALFDVIETVDREKLARALAKERDRSGRCPKLLVEINTGEEPQKAGVAPAEAEALVALCRDELDLPVAGLMCIPPAGEPAAPHFALLADMAARLGLPEVSMGMSADYEVAVQMGATSVRVGSAIFGPRG